MSSDLADALPAAGGESPLSPRESEVLGLMREGFTNADIGRLLGISSRTAKAHVEAVIEKLGVHDRTQAVARAFDLGLLKVMTTRPTQRRLR
jgi:DNA-binding NarL/FixJ family response regulator